MTDTQIVDQIIKELNKYQDPPLDPVKDREYLVVNIGGRLAQGKLAFELLKESNEGKTLLISLVPRINRYITWAKAFWSK